LAAALYGLGGEIVETLAPRTEAAPVGMLLTLHLTIFENTIRHIAFLRSREICKRRHKRCTARRARAGDRRMQEKKTYPPNPQAIGAATSTLIRNG
jgi:hypothetical protein